MMVIPSSRSPCDISVKLPLRILLTNTTRTPGVLFRSDVKMELPTMSKAAEMLRNFSLRKGMLSMAVETEGKL